MQAADDQEDPELEDDYRKILRYLKDEGHVNDNKKYT